MEYFDPFKIIERVEPVIYKLHLPHIDHY